MSGHKPDHGGGHGHGHEPSDELTMEQKREMHLARFREIAVSTRAELGPLKAVYVGVDDAGLSEAELLIKRGIENLSDDLLLEKLVDLLSVDQVKSTFRKKMMEMVSVDPARPPDLGHDQLRVMDISLNSNIVSDYSRVNHTEVLMAMNYNMDLATKHWRMARIMDGIVMCSKEFKICDDISPAEIPEKIYDVLKVKGGAQEKTWNLNIENPETGEPVNGLKASLEQFARFMNVYEILKSTGQRMDWKNLVYNFFVKNITGVEIEKEVSGGVKKKIDLADEVPADNFADLSFTTGASGKTGMDDYIKELKKYRAGFQLMESFRYKSENHRENAGHGFMIKLNGVYSYIPISGLMAAEITATDLKKASNKGQAGHPHEVADAEENTGAFVRFNVHKLQQQRNHVKDRSTHSATTARFMQAAVGLQSKETAQTEEIGGKKVVYLGGKNAENSTIIKAMKYTHDGVRKRMGMSELTNEQASDMMFTNVIAPFFLTNPNDWMMCLAVAYDVKGVSSAGDLRTGIIQSISRDEWADFEIKIMAKDVLRSKHNAGSGEIKELRFTSYRQFADYAKARLHEGDIDQRIEFSEITEKPIEKVSIKESEFNLLNNGLFAKIFPPEVLSQLDAIKDDTKFDEFKIKLIKNGLTEEVTLKDYLSNKLETMMQTADDGKTLAEFLGGDVVIDASKTDEHGNFANDIMRKILGAMLDGNQRKKLLKK